MTKLSEIKSDKTCDTCGLSKGHRGVGDCYVCKLEKENDRLKSVIDQLAEGLMFYSDERAWHRKEIGLDPNGCIARDDLGEKAREALKVLEE